MYTWLSRILAVVFMFQTLAPQMLQAKDTYSVVKQGVAEGKDLRYIQKMRELDQEFRDWRALWIREGDFDLTKEEDREIFTLLENPQIQRLKMFKILWFDRIFFDGRHAQLWETYHFPQLAYLKSGVPSEKSVCNLYNVIKDLHTESSWMDQVEEQIRQKEFTQAYYAEQQGQAGAYEQWLSHSVSEGKPGRLLAANLAFTQGMENGSITLDDLIEYMDPWHSSEVNLQHIIVAAEVWGNTLDAWAASPQDFESEEGEEDEELAWNEEVFNRALDELLLKLQLRIIYRLGQLKPLAYTSDIESIKAAGTLHILLLKIKNFYEKQNRPNPLESKSYSCGIDFSAAGPYSPMTVSGRFYKQVQRFSKSGHDENSVEYQQFLTLLDYAVAYEVTNNFMGNIESYVKILNGTLKKYKYKQRLSPALEHLFLLWYENIRYNNNKQTQNINDIVMMFSQFTDEEKYALPTRIFALEVLSHMAYNQNKEPIRQNMEEGSSSSLGFSQTFYNYNMSDEWLAYWAQLVADIYCPLVSTGRYSMKDYGLDSSQMKLLADKLGSIYAGFVRKGGASLEGPQLWSATYDSEQCTVSVLGNPVNMLKKKKEMEDAILRFIGEAIFWVYGGEIFAFVGVAFRVTRGAMLALPKAVKASVMANRGRKGLSFAVEVQKGVRMSNLSSNLTRNGVRVSATRAPAAVAERQVVQGSTVGGTSVTETVNLTSNHALRNQYSVLNPRRWIGQRPGQVLEYQVVQQTPGFGLNVGRVSGAHLPNGIHSYQDWRVFRNNLFDVTGQRMTLNTYSFAEQQLLRSEALVLRSVDKMSKSGAFDLWFPKANGGYYNMRGFASQEEAQAAFAQYLANPTEELFITASVPNSVPVVNSLGNMAGIRVSVPEVVSGTWKNRVAAEIYQPVDWGGTVSNLLMPRYVPRHMPLFSAPGRMLKGTFNSSSFASGLANTTKFFLGMEVVDRALYPSFNGWLTSTAEEEQTKLMEPYAATFDPQRLREDEEYQEEILSSLREQGFSTAPLNPMYNEVIGAANPEHAGTSITFPLLSAWHYSSKLPFTWWNSPFESEGARIAVQTQALQLERNRLTRKYTQALDRQAEASEQERLLQTEEYARDLVNNCQQAIINQREAFAIYKQNLPGEWDADEQDVLRILDRFQTEIRAAVSIENVDKREKQLVRVRNKYEKQLEKKMKAVQSKIYNAENEGLEKEIRNLKRSQKDIREDLGFRLQIEPEKIYEALIPELGPWVERYQQFASKYIQRFETLKKDFSNKRVENINKTYDDFYAEQGRLDNEFNLWVLREAARSNELYPEESTEVPSQAY